MRILIVFLFCLFMVSHLAQGESLYINGVLANELLSHKEYLTKHLRVISINEKELSLYTPVKEVCLLQYTLDDQLLLKDVNDEKVIRAGGIPVIFDGWEVPSWEIPVNTVGLLWEGKEGKPVLIYFFQQIVWDKVIGIGDED